MVLKYLNNIARYSTGLKLDSKIIIIESDDWGSIRIPNSKIRDKLFDKFPEMKKDPYSWFDTLESADDLTALYDVLIKHKDYNRRNPCITTNTIMANPDFELIRDNDYKDYKYERFDRTIASYYGEEVNKIWKNGVDNRLFVPQLHGREHLHSLQWMNELQLDNKELMYAFSNKTFTVPYAVNHGIIRNNLMSALNISGLPNEKEYHEKYLREGNKLFEEYFGYKSMSFIATTYIWNNEHEEILNNLGIKAFQGIGYQYMPINRAEYKRVFHYTGQKNKHGQYYFVRNAFFEPTLYPNKDWVGECMKRINLAFMFKKPVIIGTHRLNFIGTLEEKNRKDNLKMFDELLSRILKKWPDVEFSSTDKLLQLFKFQN